MGKRKFKKIIYALFIMLIIILSLFFIMNKLDRNQIVDNSDSIEIEVEKALSELDKSNELAQIITSINTDEDILSLNFQGLSNHNTNEEILEMLVEHKVKTQFFVTGNLASENSQFIKNLKKQFHHISSNTLHGHKKMESLTQEELVNDFVRANHIIKKITKTHPEYLVANSTEYTDEVLRAAYVSNNKEILKPSHYLSYQSFNEYEEVLNYIKNIDRGSILMIKMDGVLEEDEYEAKKNEKPAEDKKPSENVDEKSDEQINLSPEERLINMVKWILKAIDEVEYDLVYFDELSKYATVKDKVDEESNKDFTISDSNYTWNEPSITLPEVNTSKARLDQLRKENNGKIAKEIYMIHTTEKALTYTFYGIENKEVLQGVLENLDKLNAKATFFVSNKNIIENAHEIKLINDKGHEIGLALSESIDTDYYSSLENIIDAKEEITNLTSQNVTSVRYPYFVNIENEILEAISSAGMQVVWDDLSIASSRYGVNAKENDIISGSFGLGNKFVQRGYNIYFRMDYYENTKTIPNLMLRIHEEKIRPISYTNKSLYEIKTVGSLLASKDVYQYPVAKEDVLPRFQNGFELNQLSGLSDAARFELILNKYIGNPHTSNLDTLPGFTQEEIEQIDVSGRFTDDKVLFLTFDDWSSDKPINQILYVLNKHNVKANFYIRTNYMLNNPNILRAIALEGHDIGNHSDHHLPLANFEYENKGISKYSSLNEQEVNVVKEDLLTAQNKLISVVGDININHRPALTNILRPPTLAISRSGLEGSLDLGFDYILSGDFSTHDYEIYDPSVLADRLVNGFSTEGGSKVEVNNGTVYIMHMYDYVEIPNDKLNVTAEALDIAIPILKSKGYQFARISDYLN